MVSALLKGPLRSARSCRDRLERRGSRQVAGPPKLVQVRRTAVPPLAGQGFAEGGRQRAGCAVPGRTASVTTPRAPAEGRQRGGKETIGPSPGPGQGRRRWGQASSLMHLAHVCGRPAWAHANRPPPPRDRGRRARPEWARQNRAFP